MKVYKGLFNNGDKISSQDIHFQFRGLPLGSDIFSLDPGLWLIHHKNHINMPERVEYGMLLVLSTKLTPTDTRINLYMLIAIVNGTLKLFLARPPIEWVEM